MLFDNAIVQAGAAKGLKFVIFRLWKNGFHVRSRLHHKRSFIAERRHRKTVTMKPFQAWKEFIAMKAEEKEKKRLETLEKRLSDLGNDVANLKKQKQLADNKAEHLTKELQQRDEVLGKQHTVVMAIYREIAKDRGRLLGLCALVEPILLLSNVVEDGCNSTVLSLNTMLDNLSVRPMHDYSRSFEVEVRELVRHHRKKAATAEYSLSHASHSETSDESRIGHKILFEFVNTQSRDVGTRSEHTSGRSLAKFLPVYERVTDYAQLKNGRQLCRVIMALVYDRCEHSEQLGEPCQRLSLDQWEDLQSTQNKPTHLVRLMLKHAAFYLHLPLYRFQDILDGNAEVIQSLVGHLMLLSAPLMHPDHLKTIDRDRANCKAVHSALHHLMTEQELRAFLSRISGIWKTLNIDLMCLHHPIDIATIPTTQPYDAQQLDSAGEGGTTSVSEGEEGAEEGVYTGDGRSDFFERLMKSLEKTEGLPLDAEIADKYPIFKLHTSFCHLNVAVDELLAYEGERKLVQNIGQLKSNVLALAQLRSDVDHLIKESEDGTVLAGEMRLHVALHTSVSLLRNMKAITDYS